MAAGVLLGIACIGAFISASLAAGAIVRGIEKARSSARMQEIRVSGVPILQGGDARRARMIARAQEIECVIRYCVRNGIESLGWCSKMLLRIRCIRSTFEDASKLLLRRGWECSPAGLASLAVCGLAGIAAVTLIVFRSLAGCVLVPTCVALCVAAGVSRGRAKEQELLRDQVPDALRCMEACLHAGLSLPQAFAEVASAVQQPAKETFSQVSRDLELGYSVSDALERFHKVSEVPELAFVAMALDVQYTCGGSATPILRAAEESVVRGLDLRRSLRVQTAQAKLSAQIVSVMPFLLLALLSLISPGFLSPFFERSEGVMLLLLALFMQAAGIAAVRKTLAVQV